MRRTPKPVAPRLWYDGWYLRVTGLTHDTPAMSMWAQGVLPTNVSRNALATIHGTIRVKVRVEVDSSGSVERARVETGGPSKYFAQLALEAARQWTFAPAKATDREVADEWILRFEFFRTDTKVVPVRSFPRHN